MQEHNQTVTITAPAYVQQVLDLMTQAGFRAYLVGGCVRDRLQNKEPPDWDVATDATPKETLGVLSPHMRVVPTGERHGTVTAFSQKKPVEVTTFRVDGQYTDSRRPDSVRFCATVQEDLARRDFTINAMAYSTPEGLIDPFLGREDLKAGVIRAVGEPDARFSEDALRILRALRFSAQHAFTIEAATERSMIRHKEGLKRISGERIGREMSLMLCGQNIGAVLRRCHRVLSAVIPEIEPMIGLNQRNAHHLYDVWEHTVKVVENVNPTPVLRFSALLHDMGKPACFTVDENGVGHFYAHPKMSARLCDEILTRLRFDTHTRDYIRRLVENHDAYIAPTKLGVRRALGRLGEELFFDLLQLKAGDCIGQGTHPERLVEIEKLGSLLNETLKEKACVTRRSLMINGRDITTLGVPEGRQVGRLLDMLLAQVIDGSCKNEHDALLRRAQRLLKDPRNFL